MSARRSRSSRSLGAYRSYRSQPGEAAVVSRQEWFRFWVVAAVIAVVALGGGSARPDVLSLLYLRPLILVALVLILAAPGRRDYRLVKAPLILLTIFLATFLVQLIPLPPSLWMALPGHAPLADAAAAAGIEPIWRPISLSPEWTLNSSLSLALGYVVLLGVAAMPLVLQQRLLVLLVGCGVVSCLLAVGQVSGGEEALQFYNIHSNNLPNGLFANRNHHAVWLAALLPLLAGVARTAGVLRRPYDWRITAVAIGGLLILLMIPVTGSRAGVVAAGLMLIAALLIAFGSSDGDRRGGKDVRRRAIIAVAIAVLLAGALLGLLALTGKSLSLARFQEVSALEDQRAQTLPLLIHMAGEFLPFGAGQGAFDPLFRFYEPDDMLSRVYLNHAHNDLLETAILGGVPALLALLLFLGWLAKAGWAALRADGPAAVLGRAALAAAAVLLLASLADYPIRTPLVTLTFSLCCGLVAQARPRPVLLAGPGESRLPFDRPPPIATG